MREVSKRIARDNLELNVISKFKKEFPTYDHLLRLNRMPSQPKIVVYQEPQIAPILNRLVPQFAELEFEQSTDSEEIYMRGIAKSIAEPKSPDSKLEELKELYGSWLINFPKTRNAALILDQYLNGVNLAILMKTARQNQEYYASIKDVLSYYEERGTLLELDNSKIISEAELMQAQKKIFSNIKNHFTL